MTQKTVARSQVNDVAGSLLLSALTDRCRDMITRLATPSTFAAEVAFFRRSVFDHIEEAIFDVAEPADAAEGRQLARDDIDAICLAWLRGQHVVSDGPLLN